MLSLIKEDKIKNSKNNGKNKNVKLSERCFQNLSLLKGNKSTSNIKLKPNSSITALFIGEQYFRKVNKVDFNNYNDYAGLRSVEKRKIEDNKIKTRLFQVKPLSHYKKNSLGILKNESSNFDNNCSYMNKRKIKVREYIYDDNHLNFILNYNSTLNKY